MHASVITDVPAPLPSPANPARHGIAIIGAGSIVTSAHLPAYRKMGYRIEGIHDIDPQRAQQAAARFDVPCVFDSLEDILACERVKVVDIALPPGAQERLVSPICRAGKHLLCQKPLAERLQTARDLVQEADRTGVHLAVNVNMRWSPAVRVLRQLVEQGKFGTITSASIQVNFWDTWDTWPWLQSVENLMILYDTIHLLDAVRFLFGDADSIYAATSHVPGQQVHGETEALLVLRYRRGLTVFIHGSSNNWAQDTYAQFRVEGTEGMAKGILGVWYDYPVGRADRISFCRRENPGHWESVEPPGRWVPDAWAWTMAELFGAIEGNHRPLNSGADHLRTLQYIEAAYRSAARGQAVGLDGPDAPPG